MIIRKKLFVRAAVSIALCFAMVFGNAGVGSAQTYYIKTETTEIAKGISWSKASMITDAGLVDVYTMRVDLKNPNISVNPVTSAAEYGLKETAAKLLKDSGAVAGINGDFFGMAGAYSVPIGLTVAEGGILSLSSAVNAEKNESASLFIGKDGLPFADYLKAKVVFLNDGAENIEAHVINRIVDLSYPSVVTRAAMKTTADLDARIKNSVKLIVRGGKITYISKYGETVEIPEDGYAVIMSEALAKNRLSAFAVGQKAELKADYSVDLNKISAAVSGGDIILRNGEPVAYGGSLAKDRHPRTAIGYTKDKNTLIMMVVDGRTHSAGADYAELAALMKERGAYDAVNLDGGGSSAFVVRETGGSGLYAANTLSEGAPRKIISAVGVFDSSPLGEPAKLVIDIKKGVYLPGAAIDFGVYCLDENGHRIDISKDEAEFSSESDKVSFVNGQIFASEAGSFEISAGYKGLEAKAALKCLNPANPLSASAKEIAAEPGKPVSISFSALSRDGESIYIPAEAVKGEVVPPALGKFENGVFTTLGEGAGWVKFSAGGAVCYVPVYTAFSVIKTFDINAAKVSALAYPEGSASASAGTGLAPGAADASLVLNYSFAKSADTQAAYLCFDAPLALPDETVKISAGVFGDGSGNWLRGRLIDAEGTSFNIDFAKNVDWKGFKTLSVEIPGEAVRPARLERIYAASLGQDRETSGTLYISGVRALAKSAYNAPETPETPAFADYRAFEYSQNLPGYDLTFAPPMSALGGKQPADYAQNRDKAAKSALNNSEGSVYLGLEAGSDFAKQFTYAKTGEYHAFGRRDSQLITMNSQGGGFMKADPGQWGRIEASMIYTYTDNIIISTDVCPLDFANKKEGELFHELLVNYAAKGKRIFVISTGSAACSVTVKDGVRYIKTAGMYDAEGKLNGDYAVVRFRISGGDIRYKFDYVFR